MTGDQVTHAEILKRLMRHAPTEAEVPVWLILGLIKEFPIPPEAEALSPSRHDGKEAT